jgi:hypothetical protein
LLFNPVVTFYAARRETQVLPAGEGRPNEFSKEGDLQMNRFLAPFTMLVLAITMSISALAGTVKKDTVTINHPVQLNGTTIPAGDYKVTCETNGTTAQVKFMQGKKEVASATGQTKELGQRFPTARLLLNTGGGGVPSIQELDLTGTTGVVFGSAMANSGE